MVVEIEQFMCRSDSFGILMRERPGGEVALVDAPEETAILQAVERTGWRPKLLLVTHHHPDHVEANIALKKRFGLRIVGPLAEAAKIPGIDEGVAEGDEIAFGEESVRVLETPGHTAGHVSYYLPGSGVLFAADTLFALGCGRLFEGTPATMHASLMRLAELPPETAVYCGHEYTLSNARFALTVDPGNEALKQRAKTFEELRAAGKPTLPTTIGDERATNPFLRAADPMIRRNLGMEGAKDVEVFAELRKRKDVS